MKNPRPGAHNHIEGMPAESLDFVREMAEERAVLPFGPPWEPTTFEDSENGKPIELDREPKSYLVRFTYKRRGHPRAALEAVLAGISKSVFETEILDA